MRDRAGVEWLPIREASDLQSVKYPTLRKWITRGKVEARKVDGRLWVRLPDVMDAEHATRGAYLAQREGRMSH